MKKSKVPVGLTVGKSIFMGFLSLILILLFIVFIFLKFYTPSVAIEPEELILEIPPEIIFEPDEDGNMPITQTAGDKTAKADPDDKTAVPANKGNSFYNILVCGRDVTGGTTDTIIIASFDVKNQQLSILSVPRDTYLLSTPSSLSRKINAVFQSGYSAAKNAGKDKNDSTLEGLKTLRAIIKQVLGIQIHYSVYVDISGFKELVDIVGGVEVDVPFAMQYSDPDQGLTINIPAGLQTLNGKQAEGFVRYRSGYSDQDYGRMRAQQQFLTSLMKKCMAQSVTKLNQFISAGYKYIVTDLKAEHILYFAKEMLKLTPENIRFNIVPSEGRYINGGAYVTLYKEETMQIVNKYHNWYTEDLLSEKFSIAEYPRILTDAVVNIDGTTMAEMGN